jgi:dCMP deaminase
MERPTWDQFFMKIVDTTALRATCDRGRSAAVITRDNRILSAGYVGNVSGMPHCDEVGHTMRHITEKSVNDGAIYHDGDHCISTVHAEANAIANAARNGVPLLGATMYCSMTPCFSCAKLIVQCGIKRVIAKFSYHHSNDSIFLFKESNVELIVLNKELSYETK